MADELQVGDHVERVVFRGEASRTGTIEDVYRSAPSTNGESIALYAVQWDDSGYIERGYMRHGLVRCSVQALPAL